MGGKAIVSKVLMRHSGHGLLSTTRTEMRLEEIQANLTQQLSEKFAYAYSFHLNRETQAINVWRGT